MENKVNLLMPHLLSPQYEPLRLKMIWYHVLLDIWASKLESKWIYSRSPNEQSVVPYSPSILSILESTAHIALIGPQDKGHELIDYEEVNDGDKIYVIVPYLKFIYEAMYLKKTLCVLSV